MKIKIKAFANVREILGYEEKPVEVPEDSCVSDVVRILSADYPGLKSVSAMLLFACNENYCSKETRLSENDTLALFPPVSGG